MFKKQFYILALIIILVLMVGCSLAGDSIFGESQFRGLDQNSSEMISSNLKLDNAIGTESVRNEDLIAAQISPTSTLTATPTSTITSTPTSTEVVYDVGEELTIKYLRNLKISGSEIIFEEKLADRSNYYQYRVSYISEENKIYGLLTVPFTDPPEGGYKAIVFNHGYIPPSIYRTNERYVAYVDYLARSGFVVLKIDYRGHGESEGEASGTYFSPAYTIDSISAFKSLQRLDNIDPKGIGMWGHSMAGNLVLRAMLIEPDIQAGVIWAGAVYSYDDFSAYGINDTSYRPPPTPESIEGTARPRRSQEIFDTYGRPNTSVDYWRAVSLTENIEFLNSPLQLHHAEDDTVVNIAYSFDLAVVLQENGKAYEFYTYEGGGHNLISPAFNTAMQRTVAFFKENL